VFFFWCVEKNSRWVERVDQINVDGGHSGKIGGIRLGQVSWKRGVGIEGTRNIREESGLDGTRVKKWSTRPVLALAARF
jgi:hypothetical protein